MTEEVQNKKKTKPKNIAMEYLHPFSKNKCASSIAAVCVFGTYSIRLSPPLLTQPILTFTSTVCANPSGPTAGKANMVELLV